MPSTYAHYRFGRDVYRLLPEDIRRLIKGEGRTYLVGLHGPDIFFYNNPLFTNRINSIGYGMHEKPARRFFERALCELESSREINTDAMLSYIYGFICHYALDHACHTYVEQKIMASGVPHTEIEVEFDRMLMLEDGLNPLTHRLTGHISPDMRTAWQIKQFFPELTVEEVQRSLASMIWYNDLLVAPHKVKRTFIYALLFLSDNYREMHGLVVNIKPNPLCEGSNRRLLELYEEAQLCCVSDILHFKEVYEAGGTRLDDRFAHTFGAEL